MEEKLLKTIKTSCPFPLLIYKANIRYNEVRKASGIAYILLDLFQKMGDSQERISDILTRFGIPADLHPIFGEECARLIEMGIVESGYQPVHFRSIKYFKEIDVRSCWLTERGRVLFKDGSIPTGQEKVKPAQIFFSPVTRKFDISFDQKYSPLADCFLGEQFLDPVEIDIGGMDDYVRANPQKFGLRPEERIISVEKEDPPQRMQSRKEEGLSVFMRPSGVEFSFETSDERAFFDKYYTADLITEGMSHKDSYRFVNEKGELLRVPEILVAAFEKVQNIYIPADYKKQAKRPCKLFLNGGMLEVDRNDVLQPDTKAAAEILKMLDPNAAFALIDSSGIRYYTAVRVSMPCVNFEGAFRLPLLLEYKADGVTANEVIKKLYERYTVMPLTRENGKVISFIAEWMKDAKYLSYYAENKLAECSSEDDKVSVLLELNKSFASSVGWREYFKSEGEKIFSESAAGVAFDNVIYKNALLSPLGKALSLSSGQYIQKFSARLANTEEKDLVFQALESADFSVSEILGIANVAETYMQSVLANVPIESDTEFSAQFRVLQGNLWKLNQMLGITSVSDYTLKDDFNTDEFFDAYSTLSSVSKEIQQYQPFAPKEYANLLRYIEIYRPIHELLAAERASASHPEKITRKYIDDLIARGKYKEAICDLSVKLQYELRRILNEELHATVNDMINEARDQKIIDRQQADVLHQLRTCRNGFQHPGAGEVKFNKETVEDWRDLVLQVAEN